MSFDRVKQWLETRGYGERAVAFDVSSATVPLAALALVLGFFISWPAQLAQMIGR